MRIYLVLSLLLSLASAARAQNPGAVRGSLADSATGKPLREASVSLLSAKDSSYVTFGISDGDGHFALGHVAGGRYVVLVAALGYRSRLVPVALTAATPTADVGPLRLGVLSRKLGEVVVTQSMAPVSVHGDTLDFTARAFKTQPNAAVEALLKKLPGLEVARDGSIRAQGQAVNRVLVDGKPFFGDDPKLATRNLPADMIDRVQVYDQQNDQAAFSGIDDGNRQRTLNLVTKRDKRKGYFGANGLGLGTDGRYQTRLGLGLNRFNNGRQLSALAQANNLNQQGFSDSGDPAVGDFGPAPGGPDGGGGVMIRVAPGGRQNPVNSGGAPPSSITESGAVGLNYRDAWGQHAEVATSYLASRATISTDQQLRRQNVAGFPTGPGQEAGPALLTEQALRSRSTTSSHRFNLRLDYVLDSLTSLRFTPYAWWQTTSLSRQNQQQSGAGGKLLNRGSSAYDATTSNPNAGGNLLVMRRFGRPGRTLSANLSSTLSDQDGLAFNQATNTFSDMGGAPITQQLRQRTAQSAPVQTYGLNLSYVEPLTLRHKLEVHYNFADTHNGGRRLSTDFDPASGQYDQPNPALSNEFSSLFQAQRAGLTWQKRRLRYTVGLGLDAQRAELRVHNLSADTTVQQRFSGLLPNALFSYTGRQNRSWRLSYRTRLNAPSAAQLQPVADNSNPLSIQQGNPDLRPEYAQTVVASYSQFNPANNRSAFGLLNGSRVDDRLVSATRFDDRGVQTTRPVNADGYYSLTGFLSLGQRLPAHQLNLNLATNASFVTSPSYVNETLNTSRTWSLGQGVGLNSAFNERLEFGLSANLTYQNVRYSRLPAQNAAFLTQTLTADVFYQLPVHFVLTSDLWLSYNTGRATGYNQRVALWNVGLARQFFASKQGELKLQAYDVLNQSRSLVRNTTDTYVEDVRSQVLPRYLLLSFTYNLRQFGK